MPKRELRYPEQVEKWLVELGAQITEPGEMILIGSGGLLWHASQRGINEALPENSMDIDPITDSEEIARFCYAGVIGSEFETQHGWHINLMPNWALGEFAADWRDRAGSKDYGVVKVVVPSPEELLVPKRRRNEPRDRAHADWAARIGLV